MKLLSKFSHEAKVLSLVLAYLHDPQKALVDCILTGDHLCSVDHRLFGPVSVLRLRVAEVKVRVLPHLELAQIVDEKVLPWLEQAEQGCYCYSLFVQKLLQVEVLVDDPS